MSKLIYRFEELPRLLTELGSRCALSSVVGSKSAYLSEIVTLNFPGHVPRGFVLTSAAWQKFVDSGGVDVPDELWDDTLQAIKQIEDCERLRYASPKTPLLLAVRGDSSIYLTGMLDSVTHIGLNDLTARALERTSKNRVYVWDCYRRLVQGFGVVVLRISPTEFEFELEQFKKSRNLHSFDQFTTLDYIELTKINKAIIVRKTGRPFPQDPFEQLRRTMSAVFVSSTTDKVTQYCKALNLPAIKGALIVQAMVFGNNSKQSFGAVLSSRDLISGDGDLIGEFVVNGTPADIWTAARESKPIGTFPKPDLLKDMTDLTKAAEKHFKHPVFIDYIIQDGKSFITQVAPARLTVVGRFRCAVGLVEQGITTKKEALQAIEAGDILQLSSYQPEASQLTAFSSGWRAGYECVVGKLCLTPEQVTECKRAGQRSIFVKNSVTSSDLDTILTASGLVTCAGSNLTFAAAITRLFRKTAAIGCSELQISYAENLIRCKGVEVPVGKEIAITCDGFVIADAVATAPPKLITNPHAQQVLRWADDVRRGRIAVYTTAKTASEVQFAVDVESDGIGNLKLQDLFDSEHDKMFADMTGGFTDELISQFEECLTDRLGTILQSAGTKTMTLELCDPDLTSYLPSALDLAREIGVLKGKKELAGQNAFEGESELAEKVAALKKLRELKPPNVAIGCRGVRVCLVNQEFLSAQLRAVAFAAKSARGKNAEPQIRILIPFVSDAGEIERIKKALAAELEQYGEKAVVGAALQTPRACLTAGRIAASGGFVVISLQQLTELTFGIIRKDAGWLKMYRDRGIFKDDIFAKLEQNSVAVLMNKAIQAAKQAKPDAEIAFYNEDFGDPDTLQTYIALGVNGIICKPKAVPIARLGAAKSILQAE
jgi:pyruvate,orthophosphate dikinase